MIEPLARLTDPDTSHAAADSVTNLTEKQSHVYWILKHHGPMTDQTLTDLHRVRGFPRQSESGLRTRRHELVEMGLIRDSQRRERLASGRQAIVWEVA